MASFRPLCFLVLPALVGLAGCSLGDSLGDALDSSPAAPVPVQTQGLVVGDEPLAVKAGGAIMAQGGSAADAVTAMFFAMSATYPVAVGPGGGGLCIVRDASGGTREFDFLSRKANRGGAFAVPGAVWGFYNLQKAFGTLPWQRDVSPGEAYAATGFPISRALSQRLDAAQNVIRLDAALAAEFLDESGRPKAEGSIAANVALSQTLSAIRIGGADGFYKGAVAQQIAAYAAAQGGAIGADELAGYRGSDAPAHLVNVGSLAAALPGPQTGAGAFSSALLGNLGSREAAAAASPEAAVVAAVRRTLAGFGIASLPPDLGASGFAAMDGNGMAASCAVTLNGPFGSGHTAAGTGVMLSASPAAETGMATAFLTPMIASQGGVVALAGTGAGGPNGTAAVIFAALKLGRGSPLGRPEDLRSTGAAPFDAVNAISCQNGICVALADPGGAGLGTAVALPDAVPAK